MTYEHDTRWSPGASRGPVPADALAVYSARWIDHGDRFPADVVPDRQGVACNERSDADRLFALLDANDAKRRHHALTRDQSAAVVNGDRFHVWMRRSGGYVYVDAWLDS